MRRIGGWLAIVASVGCRREPDGDGPGTTPEPLPDGTFAEIGTELGYTVQPGAVVRVDDRDCCADNALCWFSNPTAPYLAWSLPRGPGQDVPDIGASPEGLAPAYHLRADEAVVMIGEVPPEVAYWGTSSFVHFRLVAGEVTLPRGATGPSIHGAAVGGEPGDVFAVVSTMDGAVEREVVRWLEASGVPAERIHADRISPELVRPGWVAQADVFSHVTRLVGFDDADAGEAWLADPNARLYRVTPGAEQAVSAPHPLGDIPMRGSGTNEFSHAIAVAALGDAVRAQYADRPTLEVQLDPQWAEPYACIEQAFCGFDSTDRYYGRSMPFTLAEDELVVAFGVNHTRTGKATVHSLAVNEVEHLLEIGAVDEREMVGSARAWIDDALVDNLYAVSIARSCDGLPAPCVEVPAACPGAELQEALTLAVRAYLEPSTGTGPHAPELVIDRAIKVFRAPESTTDPRPTTPTGDTGASSDTGSPTSGTP